MQVVLIVGTDLLGGDGPRLDTVRVGGLSLLRRALRAAVRGGAERIVIATPDVEGARAVVDGDAQLRVPIEVVEATAPLREAGVVLRGLGDRLAPRFAVARVDGVLSPALFARAAREHEGRWAEVVDRDGRRVGLWAAALEAVQAAQEPDLDAWLTGDAPTPTLEAPSRWHPVRARADRGPALGLLLQALRKPLARHGDGVVSYFFNRPISLRISRVLVGTPVTPNHVTTAALAFGLAAAAVAAGATWPRLVLAGILLQISSILDGVDGELARLRLTTSRSGEWYDTVVDDVVNVAFMVGLGLACFRRSGERLDLVAALVAGGLGVVLSGLLYRELLRRGIASHNDIQWGFEKRRDDGGGTGGPLRPLLVGFAYLAKRDSYTVLLALLLVADLPRVGFAVMAIGTLAILIGFAIQKARDRGHATGA